MSRSEVVAEDPARAFVVRPATPRDARPFLDLYRLVADEGRFIRTDEPRRDVRHYRGVFRRGESAERASYVAVDGDRVVGSLSVDREEHPVTRHVASIGMMVAPSWRRRGVGSALMEAAIAWGRRAGVEKLELAVYPDNDAARALYTKFGFREEGRLSGHSKKRVGYRDEVLMGLWLGDEPS
jgi:RimJ/RimL family protein N-acetyltransferase